MRLLVVITTHDKYVEDGKLERCINSWKNNLNLYDDSDSYDIMVINDSDRKDRVGLGVTTSRLEGYIEARSKGYDWITFCDADAYIEQQITVPSLEIAQNENIPMVSCNYGYCDTLDESVIVVDNKIGKYRNMSISDFSNKIFSWEEERDYPVFMGRFFSVKSIKSDYFVDTKQYGDDGLFFFLYSLGNKDKSTYKIEGLVVSEIENNKGLPIDNITVGEELIKWTLSKIEPSPLRDKFVFQKLIIAYLQYNYFNYGEITEEVWNHALSFFWKFKVSAKNLDNSQLDFMSKVNNSEQATRFMKKRYYK